MLHMLGRTLVGHREGADHERTICRAHTSGLQLSDPSSLTNLRSSWKWNVLGSDASSLKWNVGARHENMILSGRRQEACCIC